MPLLVAPLFVSELELPSRSSDIAVRLRRDADGGGVRSPLTTNLRGLVVGFTCSSVTTPGGVAERSSSCCGGGCGGGGNEMFCGTGGLAVKALMAA